MITDQMDDRELILTPTQLLDVFLSHKGISADQFVFPPSAALAFQGECLSQLIKMSKAKPVGDWTFPISETHIFLGNYLKKPILISKIPTSAPNAVAFVECLISLGVSRVIATGAAGSIHASAGAGCIVIPTQAIREEGTSYCYFGKDVLVHSSKRLNRFLEESANRNNIRVLKGPTWTTDGVFRETITKMKEFSSRGVLTIEMEMSALFALAMFRKIEFAGLLVISDTHFDSHKILVYDEVYLNAQEDAARILLGALCAD